VNESTGIRDADRDGISIVVSRRNGQVVGQSRAARALLGSAEASAETSTCWSLMHHVPNAQRLPCSEGCADPHATRNTSIETHSIRLRGRAFELRCEPVGDQIVTTLRPERGQPSTHCQPLTPREVEVLQLLADGLDGTEIAAALGISPGTVRTHVEHMRASLDCRTRAGLVAKGYHLRYLG
jgi:DNA-binding CsgD family transcriptional regulator